MTDDFYQLEAPCVYYNANGVSFGVVVRAAGLNRTLFLNDINKIQDGLMVQTPSPNHNHRFYLTTALFKTTDGAFFAAEKYYRSHGQEYDYEMSTDGWRTRETIPATLVESKVMRFK